VTLDSNMSIAGITQSDFVISGVPGVTIGSWNGTTSAPFSYWLNITGFTQGGELSVTVQKPGYANQSRQVTIYAGNGWTKSTTSLSFTPNAAAYRGGRFVCVGNGSSSAWSTNDGVSWNSVSMGGSYTYTAIAGGASHFVAVGPNGRIATSENGSSWAMGSLPLFGATSIYGIAYGGEEFVAVGAGGKALYFADSFTGVTIEPVSVSDMTFGTSNIYDVVYGGNKFVAVGASGKAAYSTNNGATWTAVSDSKFGGSAISTITWGNGNFVAAGVGGKIAWSPDGITWNAVTDTTFSVDIDDIAYGDGKFVAVSANANTAYSTDGITWTAIEDYRYEIYSGTTRFSFITYGGDRFVAGGSMAYWITP
jgi:hypothetical protein